MTTIAYRDGIMAADTLCSSGNIRAGYAEKLRWQDGVGFGYAGDLFLIDWLHDWSMRQEGNDFLELPSGDISATAIAVDFRNPETIIDIVSDNKWVTRCEFIAPYAAAGSGMEMAVARMSCGGSALDAVRAAAKTDSGTQGPFVTLDIETGRMDIHD